MVHYLPAPHCSWFRRLSYSLPGCTFSRLEMLKGVQTFVTPASVLQQFYSWRGGGQREHWHCSKLCVLHRLVHLMSLSLVPLILCYIWIFSFSFFLNMLSILFTLLTNLVFLFVFILAPRSLPWQWGNWVRAQWDVWGTVALCFLTCTAFYLPASSAGYCEGTSAGYYEGLLLPT